MIRKSASATTALVVADRSSLRAAVNGCLIAGDVVPQI
jgi:hypothetical protein